MLLVDQQIKEDDTDLRLILDWLNLNSFRDSVKDRDWFCDQSRLIYWNEERTLQTDRLQKKSSSCRRFSLTYIEAVFSFLR